MIMNHEMRVITRIALKLTRRYISFEPIKIGITGSIGMGKSEVSKQLRFLGFPVFDADAAVHELYDVNGLAVEKIRSMFPAAIKQGAVDRNILSSIVLEQPFALKALEQMVHPLVNMKRREFFDDASSKGYFAVIFDIPLLFEKRMENDVDFIITVSASSETQQKRVLGRKGMTKEKLESIIQKQMPDAIKRQKAHYVINTDFEGYSESKAQLCKVLEDIIHKRDDNFNCWKRRFFIREKTAIRRDKSKNTSLSSTDCTVFSEVALVVFDLDDTLAPTMRAVDAANNAMLEFMKDNMIQTYQIPMSEVRSHMKR